MSGSTTFAFVDLSGFTALTEVHGDDEAVATATALQARVREHLAPDDLLVKTIGDAVMLAFASPTNAIERLAQILVSGDVGSLPVRAGAHLGPATRVGDDFYGHTVNLAARVAAHAVADELLVTSELAIAAQRLGRTVTHVGATSLRNVGEPLDLYRIGVVGCDGSLAVDPVCGMRVPTTGEHAIGLRCADTQWWFCGMPCVATFATRRRAAS
jgi:adenylate cyclase